MLIDGHEYLLLRDYDNGKYKYLTFNGKMTYIESRVEMILIGPCRATIAATKVKENNMGLVVTTAICAGISAASTFYMGTRAKLRGDDRAFFVAFVENYMPEFKKKVPGLGIPGTKWLYEHIRCGLAHAFMIEKGGIENGSHYIEKTKHGPQISISLFLDGFERGWKEYLHGVFTAGEKHGLGKLFNQRFDEVFFDR